MKYTFLFLIDSSWDKFLMFSSDGKLLTVILNPGREWLVQPFENLEMKINKLLRECIARKLSPVIYPPGIDHI